MTSSKRRINEVLRDYWESLRGDRAYPSESEIEPEAVFEIWDHCFLVNLTDPSQKQRGFRYTYLGTSLIEAFGDDLSQSGVSSTLIDPSNEPLVRRFGEVAKTSKPAIDDSEFTNKHGMLIKYRSCLLPLGEEKGGVNYILGGMKWKAF